MRAIAKRFAVRFSRHGARWFSWNSFLASLYYLVVNRSFCREQRAVLAGRADYWRSETGTYRETSVQLRRNIHRIEKGLIMKPRRAIFALRYIAETIDAFEAAMASPLEEPDEIRWATDVLDRYFESVEPFPEASEQRQRFDRIRLSDGSRDGQAVAPFPYADIVPHGIGHEQLLALFRHRKSVRWFERRPVPFEDIKKAVDGARLAPSSCNRQPYWFYITTDPSTAQKLASCAMGTAGYVHNIQSLIVLVGDLSSFFSERDRHLIYIDGALAAMQLMLALDTLGISTCNINWPDIGERERRLSGLLGLSPYLRPIMLIAAGYADHTGGVPFSQKKSSDLLIRRVVLPARPDA
ncbi:MAG: nitroreductase family protein [Spirochaetaceae bacterium]|nr:nitroreductase family protein [Spirochaetaceae bacterium]